MARDTLKEGDSLLIASLPSINQAKNTEGPGTLCVIASETLLTNPDEFLGSMFGLAVLPAAIELLPCLAESIQVLRFGLQRRNEDDHRGQDDKQHRRMATDPPIHVTSHSAVLLLQVTMLSGGEPVECRRTMLVKSNRQRSSFAFWREIANRPLAFPTSAESNWNIGSQN